jgi:hypothetical protein
MEVAINTIYKWGFRKLLPRIPERNGGGLRPSEKFREHDEISRFFKGADPPDLTKK